MTASFSIGNMGSDSLYLYGFVAIAVVIVALYILRYSKFGRSVYAIGGSEQSARLMGLPVSRVKILVFGISGFCAALGVLIQGTIQTIVTLLNLNAWWTKVTIAVLLCVFVVLQRIIAMRNDK